MNKSNEKKTTGAEPVPAELTARARAGDREAFAELYERTSAALYRSIRSMVGDEDRAWDVLQDTYIRAWRGLEKLEADEAFLPWLRRIAVNTTAKQMAQKQPVPFTDLADGEDDEEPALPDLRPGNQPELALDRQETSRLVREILGELPEEQRLIVGMRYYEDMSIQEIAETLQLAPGTVKAQLHRGRKRVEAGVRAMEKQGVRLYGLSPLPFLLALLRRLEPGAEEAQKALTSVLSEAPAATVTAMTAGQAFLHGLGAKLLAGALAVAMLAVGGKLGYDALKKNSNPPVGPELPTVIETVAPGETPESLEIIPTEPVSSADTAESLEIVATEDVPNTDSPESLETEPSEPPAEPTVLASGSFGLRQREEQADPNEALPYFTVVDPDAEDKLFTNHAVEIRYDGVGVRERELPDGEERLLFSLERTSENNWRLFGVTENRLYFTSNNLDDPYDWWGVKAFSVNRQGGDRQELGSGLDCFFGNGWVALLSFHSDVRPSSARIFNRNDELLLEEPEEWVWSVEAVDEALYVICVKEHPKDGESEETGWSDDLIRLDPDGTQTLLLQVPAELVGYGLGASISDGVIWIGGSDGGLYDLYTLEPLEDRYDSSFYDDSLTWTLDSSGVLTVSGTGVMGSCWTQPWTDCREAITAVVLEEGVTNIGPYAFYACSALTRVSIPDTVTDIGEYAFSQCEALTGVTIPDSVTRLGRGVFSGCSELTEVRLPAGLTGISESLFSGCASLASLTIPDSVTAIGNYAFHRCGSLTGITIPSGVTSIGERAFFYCRAMTGVTIPAGVTSIGTQAFGWYYDSSAEEQRCEGFTVSGAEGSAAQTCAEENGFRFVKVN